MQHTSKVATKHAQHADRTHVTSPCQGGTSEDSYSRPLGSKGIIAHMNARVSAELVKHLQQEAPRPHGASQKDTGQCAHRKTCTQCKQAACSNKTIASKCNSWVACS